MSVQFTVYGQPAPAGSKRGFVRGGRVVITDANAKSRPWKAQVSDAAAQAMGERGLLDGGLVLELYFTVPRPKSHYGKKGLLPSARMFPTVKPDVTKLVRAVEDALTGIVWRDDAQIVGQHAAKRYGEPASVRVVVWDATEELNAAGIGLASRSVLVVGDQDAA